MKTSLEIALEIISVQPMAPNLISDWIKVSKSESDLIKEGFKPVSSDTRFMWTKVDKKESEL